MAGSNERGQADGDAPIVGRDRLSARLHDLWSTSQGPSGKVVLVGGDPGVGKSRLVRAFADEAAGQGTAVLSGTCSPIRTFLSYEPFVIALDRYTAAAPIAELERRLGAGATPLKLVVPSIGRRLPQLEDPVIVDPVSALEAVEQSLLRFFDTAAAESGVVVILEDLHWAAKPTIALLEQLVDTAAAWDLFVVATYRRNDLPDFVAEAFHAMTGAGLATMVSVAGLDASSTDQLADAVAGAPLSPEVRQRVRAASEGNPLFVREIVRHLVESGRLTMSPAGTWRAENLGAITIPKSVDGMIAERLDCLSSPTRSALVSAAMLGRDFSFATWERVVAGRRQGVDAAAREATGAGLIDRLAGTDLYSFSHALIAEALTRDLPPVSRKRLHRNVARSLEAHYGEGVDGLADHAAELAHHYLRGGEAVVAEGARHSEVAVAQAMVAGDLELAIRCARDWWDRSASIDAALRYADVSMAIRRRSSCEEAEVVLAKAQSTCSPEHPRYVALLAMRAQNFATLNDVEAARELIAAARASAGSGAIDLGTVVGSTHFMSGRPIDALRAFEGVEVDGDPIAEAIYLSSLLLAGRFATLRVQVRGPAAGAPDTRSMFARSVSVILDFYLGAFDAAQLSAVALHRDATAPPDLLARQNAALGLGYLALERGLGREAMAWFRDAVESLHGMNLDHAAVGALVESAASCGLPAEAEQAMEGLRQAGLGMSGPMAGRTARGMAHYELALGAGVGQAARILRETVQNVLHQQQVLSEAELLHELVHLQEATGEECERLVELAAEIGSPWIVEWGDHARAWAERDPTALCEVGERYEARGAARDAVAAAQSAAALTGTGSDSQAAARSSALLDRVGRSRSAPAAGLEVHCGAAGRGG
ncbi:MAG: hypothetical protein JWN46_2969 [Acidimicrobiales bacterium]|nr:hypothetical protein [Acidimicrobiales bacterium]